MLTNEILAIISLSLLVVCVVLALVVLIGKPKTKGLAILSGLALFSMIMVTAISAYLSLA